MEFWRARSAEQAERLIYPPRCAILHNRFYREEAEEEKKMAISNMKATLPRDLQSVWEVVTSLSNYAWRSDLSRIEVINENQFVEYTKDGYPTTFTTTVKEPCGRWEFDMDNSNMKGHWIGVFTQKGNETEIDFTEEVTAKKFLMKPFVKTFLKKQQAQYIADLKKALS